MRNINATVQVECPVCGEKNIEAEVLCYQPATYDDPADFDYDLKHECSEVWQPGDYYDMSNTVFDVWVDQY